MEVIQAHRPQVSPELDPSTLSNYQNFKVKQTNLTFDVLFEHKIVKGNVKFELDVLQNIEEIQLDTSFLKIFGVKVNEEPQEFKVEDRLEPLGSQLRIIGTRNKNTSIELSIEFETTTKCTALQFLDKEATDGKKKPYLFSQCQAIHARSLFPCFDTPSVKSPYRMIATSPSYTLMSGLLESIEGNTYKFNQPIPIPSYLVALASGDIVKAPIGPRSHVFCEPLKIDMCKYEFENDMEHFIKTAESLIFKYEWDQYDALVLPGSFPYGGMENPNITFATPTLISGDRQNVDVMAHELAHSWSGNLVTNCSWEHFWLNEGWTVYIERRIQGALHGNEFRDFSAIIGWSDLEASIKAMGESASRFSKLFQDLKDKCDPDDSFSTVPYEKGFNLLYHIEKTVGGTEVFDPFIPHYFNKFKYSSLDTFQFLDTLYEFFSDKKEQLDSIDWKAWLYQPGMPPITPKFDTTLVTQCYTLADKWFSVTTGDKNFKEVFNSDDIANFNANQSVVFLNTLLDFNKKDSFSWKNHQDALRAMDLIYSSYPNSANAEVLSRWYLLQVTGENKEYYDKLGEWLGTVGRMKFVRPGYVLLNEVDHELAIKYFKKYEANYHPICKAMVKKDLGLN